MVSDNTVLLLFSHFSKFSDMASEREAKQLEAATEALGGRVADVKSSLGQLIRFFICILKYFILAHQEDGDGPHVELAQLP